MTLYTIILTMACITEVSDSRPIIFGSDGCAFGKFYRLSVPSADLLGSQKWEETDDPPLSAGKALKVAVKAITKMEAESTGWSAEWSRRTSKILLFNHGDGLWSWVVHFEWLPRNIHFSGQPPNLSIAVTMDGKAILPALLKDQRSSLPGDEK